jgi:signal transduction histidine kinase
MSKQKVSELIEELNKRFKEKDEALVELKQITEELKWANKKLEESEMLKSHFISNIANEIINPFASIIGLSKNILSVKKEDWKRVITMVALIHSEAFNLDFQFRNIFVAAKIEAGEVCPEILNVNIVSLVKSVLEWFSIEAKKKGLELEFQNEMLIDNIDEFSFKTDPEWLRLIISNLLSNAVKYSYDKGKIIVSIRLKDQDLCISVKDFGTGISEANQKTIFDRFKRLDSGINSINRGHGLGLSINKALLDFLNGRIEVKSQKENGSEFTVYVPQSSLEIEGFSSDGNEYLFNNEDEEKF